MAPHDWSAELAALEAEKTEIRRLVHEEFATMMHGVAMARATRLAAIDVRLAVVRRAIARRSKRG